MAIYITHSHVKQKLNSSVNFDLYISVIVLLMQEDTCLQTCSISTQAC